MKVVINDVSRNIEVEIEESRDGNAMFSFYWDGEQVTLILDISELKKALEAIK